MFGATQDSCGRDRHECARPSARKCSSKRDPRCAGHRRPPHRRDVGHWFRDNPSDAPVDSRYCSACADRRCRVAVRRWRCSSLPPLAVGSNRHRCTRNRCVELDSRRLLRLRKRDWVFDPNRRCCRSVRRHRRRGGVTGARRQGKATPRSRSPAPAVMLLLHINACPELPTPIEIGTSVLGYPRENVHEAAPTRRQE